MTLEESIFEFLDDIGDEQAPWRLVKEEFDLTGKEAKDYVRQYQQSKGA